MNLEKEVFELNINDIMPNRFQPREIFDEQALNELALSIKEHGVIQPIIVRKIGDKYEIIAGERRYRASQLAGKTTIPALVRDIDDKETAKIALLENLQRSDLTPIEEAKTYQTILKLDNITQEELAFKIGKSRSSVTNTLGLLRLPDNVQDMVMKNDLSMGHARVLSKIDKENEIEELASKVVEDKMSVRDLEKLTTTENVQKKIPIKRKEPKESQNYTALETTLRETLGTKVNIKDKKIEIHFENTNDLNRILEILNIKIN